MPSFRLWRRSRELNPRIPSRLVLYRPHSSGAECGRLRCSCRRKFHIIIACIVSAMALPRRYMPFAAVYVRTVRRFRCFPARRWDNARGVVVHCIFIVSRASAQALSTKSMLYVPDTSLPPFFFAFHFPPASTTPAFTVLPGLEPVHQASRLCAAYRPENPIHSPPCMTGFAGRRARALWDRRAALIAHQGELPKYGWWAFRDSNPEPTAYEAAALTIAPKAHDRRRVIPLEPPASASSG